MTNIIQFPKTNPKTNQPTKGTELQRVLDGYVKLLKKQHAHIKQTMESLSAMEKENQATEAKFTKKLQEYGDRFGFYNIPNKYLDYSTRSVPEVDEKGNITLIFKP